MSVLFAPSVCQISVDLTHVCIVRTIGLPNWCGFYSCLHCLHHPCIKLVWILLMSVLFAPSVYQIKVDLTHVCIVAPSVYQISVDFTHVCIVCTIRIKLVWILLYQISVDLTHVCIVAPSVYQISVDFTHVCIVRTIGLPNWCGFYSCLYCLHHPYIKLL